MITWIIYDISDDKKRSKVAKICLKAGLYRVQKSIFLGHLGKNQQDELQTQFSEIIDLEKDSIYLSSLSKDDFERVEIVGRGFDRNLVARLYSELLF